MKGNKKEPCANKIPSSQDLFGAVLLGSVLWMRYLEGDVIGSSIILVIITILSLGNVASILFNLIVRLITRVRKR